MRTRLRRNWIAIATLVGLCLLGQLAQAQAVIGNQSAQLGSQLTPQAAPASLPERPQSQTSQLFDRVREAVTDQATAEEGSAENFFLSGPEHWTSRDGLSSSLQVLLLLTVLSLAPAILLMTTCYVRIIVVMGLLRQALGTGQLPPSQVITAISLFMTMFVMAPVWNRVYDNSIAPYTAADSTMTIKQAWDEGIKPIREFMIRQIDFANNDDDVMLFYRYYTSDGPLPQNFEEVPLQVLLPAFMLSELKTAFLMGFQIFLPFLLIDLVVASVTISMGMMMLPPALISLPFKLLLFVLIDGWHLVVEMLLESFGTYV